MTVLLDLPYDMLLEILTRMRHNDRVTLSSASKFFRDLTDPFVHQLTFHENPSQSTFPKLFSRFTSVTRIAIKDRNCVRDALFQISRSQLKIESLEVPGDIELLTDLDMDILSEKFTRVKVLKLFSCDVLEVDSSGVKFARLFPFLEELDCRQNYCWSDSGIQILMSSFPNLRKVNFDHSDYMTDKSLDALGNCVYLEEVSLVDCDLLTLQGLGAFIRKRNNLKSLSLSYDFSSVFMRENYDSFLALAETISKCENLTHLFVSGDLTMDDFLSIVSKSSSSLTSLKTVGVKFEDTRCTMKGLAAMLRANQGLTKLHVYLPWDRSNTDQDMEMSKLVKSLSHLKDVFILSQFPARATLISLTQNCPLLEDITLECETHFDVPPAIRKNFSVQRSILRIKLSRICYREGD